MSTISLFALLAATMLVSVAILFICVWLAVRRRGWRVAAAVTCEYMAWAIGLTAVWFVLVWLSQNQPIETRRMARGAAALLLIVGELIVMRRALRDRAQMTGGRGWVAAFAVLAGAGAITLAVALTLRAKVVEAFIVPTGAMAPTILGQHQRAACSQCGFAFAVGPRDFAYAPSGEMLPTPNKAPIDLTCSNCGLPIALTSMTPILEGDRVLADKTAPPRRWDLIIFRNPQDPSVNYVKRLVGLPGERIGIRDGEVYADGKLLRKPLDTLDDLWFPVHDTGFAPTDGSTPTIGWRTVTDGDEGAVVVAPITLGGEGNPSAIRFTGPITISPPYNASTPIGGGESEPVGDIRVTIELADGDGDESFSIGWSHGSESIRADVRPGGVDVHRERRGDRSVTHFKREIDTRSITLTIRDRAARVDWGQLDGVGLIDLRPGDASGGEPAFAAEPGEAGISITADTGALRIARIRVWRDVYYTELGEQEGVAVGPDAWFVLGDNSAQSKDSRFIGPVPRGNLIGVARWRYWPPGRWHTFAAPVGSSDP